MPRRLMPGQITCMVAFQDFADLCGPAGMPEANHALGGQVAPGSAPEEFTVRITAQRARVAAGLAAPDCATR